jgi:hypothetical protein
MFINSEEIKTLGLSQVDAFTAAANSTVKGLLAITTEATGYSKKSVENGFALWERLLHAREPDEIVQLQSDFGKAAYDDFVAGATKISNIYADLAKEAFSSSKAGGTAQSSDVSSSSAPKRTRTPNLDAIAA